MRASHSRTGRQAQRVTALRAGIYFRPSGFLSRKLESHSVVTDLGRSSGRLTAHTQHSRSRVSSHDV